MLDAPMLALVKRQKFEKALDVGCGEGRFCRMLQAEGISAVGIDPTTALVERARQLDPGGDYRIARAETLDVAPASFDLVVTYLRLVDIPNLELAVTKMSAPLRPGGTLLVANLTSFNAAGMPEGWRTDFDGQRRFCIDDYLDERTAFLERGLELLHFDEPVPSGGDAEVAKRYRRVPFFVLMEWQKPNAERGEHGSNRFGGIFFRARDPEGSAEWYSAHFGITPPGETVWQQQPGPTVFMPFAADTDYFAADKQFMFNHASTISMRSSRTCDAQV